MTHPREQYEELIALADAQCNGAANDDEIARLEQLLRADPAARRVYLRYSFLHADLCFCDEALDAELTQTLAAGDMPTPPAPATLPARAAIAPDLASSGWVRQSLTLFTRPGPFSLLVAAVCTLSLVLTTAQFPAPVAPPATASPSPPSPTNPAAPSEPPAFAEFKDGEDCRWVDSQLMVREGQTLAAGQELALAAGTAEIIIHNGVELMIEGPTVFRAQSQSAGYLESGKVRVKVPPQAIGFAILTPALEVIDLGTEFTVEIRADGQTRVEVLQGAVETRSRLRLPRHYWNFEPSATPLGGALAATPAALGPAARITAGLVGEGACEFDNSPQAFVNVGGAPDAAGDPYALSAGVSIEALFVSRWSGLEHDYDEIFRKEDGEQRILLSFQHDPGTVATAPAVPLGPCLAFGLHLAGHGYSELDMPLDGKDGRPTLLELTDGRPHHVVATYNAATGRKAIYLDGRRCWTAHYPRHTPLVSGGRAPAILGNNFLGGNEPFSGVLDEVAIYDFALSEQEIAAHHANFRAGKDYFGAPAKATGESSPLVWKPVNRLQAGDVMHFDAALGLPLAQ